MPLERSRSAKVLLWKPPTRADGRPVKIGVGITVQNRHQVSDDVIAKWRSHLRKGMVLVVVDDGSDFPYEKADFRFEEVVGIARAKNKCLELLEDLGVEEFFLADNDCFPTDSSWWVPYVESPEPHLSYQFLDLVGPVKLHDTKELYRDKYHVAYTGQRGCLLYYNKVCLETVGGFDPIYGRALYEHVDLADRIHAAGLTTWRYADVAGSQKLWHSMDEHVQVDRTVPRPEQAKLLTRNVHIQTKRRAFGYQAFVPYRDPYSDASKNVVITTLLTSGIDPQRGYKWDPDPKMISPWLESMERGGWDGVILADELKSLPRGYSAEVVHVEPSEMNVYHQRWLHIYQYLRAHPELKWVWCTDGSDVEVLRDPFFKMSLGKLYVGVDDGKVHSTWMVRNHQAAVLRSFMKNYSEEVLLNAGVVGGDRQTVQDFAQKIVTLYDDIAASRFFGFDLEGTEVGDMAAFNKVAYESFGSNLVYGPTITTEFKKFEDNGTAKFKHK